MNYTDKDKCEGCPLAGSCSSSSCGDDSSKEENKDEE